MAPDLVFEIGTEEIPSDEVASAIVQLKTDAGEAFVKARLSHDSIDTIGTPRRVTLMVKGLAEEQSAAFEETRGPAKRVAFDEAGKPTPAAAGFAKSQGVDVSDLQVKETEQGEYVFAVKAAPAARTHKVLPGLLLELVLALSFRKSMRWGDRDLKFARPIRWLMAVYGSKTIKLDLAGIPSGNLTYGHRNRIIEPLKISKAADYEAELKLHNVVVDQRVRRDLIVKGIEAAAAQAGGRPAVNPDVLEEVIYLVESPHAIAGSFAQGYLKLPRVVTVTAMEAHQRYVPVESEQGELMPAFVVVHNGPPEHDDLIRQGHERVLKARLDDALFFFDEDRAKPLADRVEDLKGVVFQEKLGTVHEKAERLVELAGFIARSIKTDEVTAEHAKRAARLAKADLTTSMVREFPALQGVIGGEYGRLDGKSVV